MNHDEAVKTMAVERYLLKEMSPEEVEAFESHIFDCKTCFLDVKISQKFIAAIK